MGVRDIAYNYIYSEEANASFDAMIRAQFVQHLYQAELDRQAAT
jgi:CO dehydrogenase/acetyl-CoA synthase epsilon subunit